MGKRVGMAIRDSPIPAFCPSPCCLPIPLTLLHPLFFCVSAKKEIPNLKSGIPSVRAKAAQEIFDAPERYFSYGFCK